jgi:hypothetical protein
VRGKKLNKTPGSRYTVDNSGGGMMRSSTAKSMGMTALIALILGMQSCGLRPEQEISGNNSFGTAMPVQSGRTIKAVMADAGEADYFRISETQRSVRGWDEIVSEGKDIIVHIDVRYSQGTVPVTKLYRGNRVIKVIDDGLEYTEDMGETGFTNARFTAEEVLSGKAVFSIENGSSTEIDAAGLKRQYELRIEVRASTSDEEAEPNDKPVQATGFGESGLLSGYFDPALNAMIPDDGSVEVDWYSFTIADEQERSIRHVSISAVPNVDSVISVYDELGYLVREADSNGVGEIEKLMNIGLPRGKFFVKVKSAERGQKNSEVGYLLKIETSDATHSEYEPNDRYIFANDTVFLQDIYGYFNPIGDSDWFRVSIYDPQPQIISIKISPTEDINPVIAIYSTGEQLIRMADDRGIDEGEIIKNIGAEEGIYYINVYNRNPERDNPDSRYTLLIEKREWQEDEEFEVNDELDLANPIVLNGLKRGYVSPRKDRDYYAFAVQGSGEDSEALTEVTLELSPCVLIDLAMHVFDEQGQVLEEINNNPAEEGERETLFLKDGKYFVEVFSMNEFENSRDAYTLRIY